MKKIEVNQVNNASSGDLSSLQRAAMTIRELKSRLEKVKQTQQEPIAIVGMACRFPGAPDLDSFWELLKHGVDAVTEVPRQRWDLEQWFDPNPNAPGKINTRYGGFIDDVECFDATFFGIPPREARLMDPGQRILLQLVWNALEHAAIPPHSLRGSNTGFFVGMSQNDYGSMQINGDPDEISAYSGTGNGGCFASGRISYQFGFNGPTLSTDTACSSSLVALNQAISALRSGESDLALASGVHLNLTPPMQIFFSRTQSFSPDGRCHTFDAGANGFVLGEGAGVVVLQRLSDAVRDGRRILGVVRSASVNHGGASGGLTVPNEAAQEALIKYVLKTGKIEPDSIDYVETHGTGTNLGDPIEVGALRSVFGNRPADNPLLIGSVKTNIGHLNAAAGMAGLIKTILMLKHRQIVPNLHYKKPNPEIPWEGFPVKVPTDLSPWPGKNGNPRRAGLSSFGLSGTNVHVVLEEAPGVVSTERSEVGSGVKLKVDPLPAESEANKGSSVTENFPARLYTVSAHSETALREQAGQHLSKLSEIKTDDELVPYCYRANAGRSHLEHRAVITCSDSKSLLNGLEAVQMGTSHENVLSGQRLKGFQSKLLMVLTENPLPGLKALLPLVPFCREEITRLSKISGIDLWNEIEKSDNNSYSSIAGFTAFVIITGLWKKWGIQPSAIQTDGEGELAAAVFANAISVEDAFQALKVGGKTPEMGRPEVTLLKSDGSRLEKLSGQIDDKVFTLPEGYTTVLSISQCRVITDQSDLETQEGVESKADFWANVLNSISRLYILGLTIDWHAFESSGQRGLKELTSLISNLPDLSGYPFAKDRYWLEKSVNTISTPEKDIERVTKRVNPTDRNSTKIPTSSNSQSVEISGESSGQQKPESLARIMEMQLRMTTESLRQVTNQQFDYLRNNGFESRHNTQGKSSSNPNGSSSAQENTNSPNIDTDPVQSGKWKLLLLDGEDETELEIQKQNTVKLLKTNPELILDQSRRNLQSTSSGGKRLMLTYQTPEEAVSLLNDSTTRRVVVADRLADQSSLIYMFPGVGDHYLNFGKGLYECEPLFRKVVDECCLAIESELGTDLRSIIYPELDVNGNILTGGDEGTNPHQNMGRKGNGMGDNSHNVEKAENESANSSATAQMDEKPRFDFKAMLGRGTAPDPRQERMNQTRYSQPLNFIIEYALGKLWQARGLKPDAMIGYSIGEYCAAVLSGVMQLEDALILVTKRAELIETILPGAMLAVPLGMKEVEVYLGNDLSVAISSTPKQSVVAGPVAAVEALEKVLKEKEIICRRLQGTHAFHTPMLQPLHQPLLELTGKFELKAPEIPFISNLTGTWIENSEATSAEYWAKHTWKTVRFSEGMGHILSAETLGQGGRIFLEVGPGVSLGSFMLQHPESAKVKKKMNLASLRTMYEKMPDEQFLLNSVGKLYLAGYKFSTKVMSVNGQTCN